VAADVTPRTSPPERDRESRGHARLPAERRRRRRGARPDHPAHLHRRGEGRARQRRHAARGHPGLKDRLVEAGGLRRFVNVYVNDEDVRFLDGLATPLAPGDSVTVLPAVAGG
jgi:hypothetical protein